MQFPGQISACRAMLYAYMCGSNTSEVNEIEFLAGCNRFAIDNPMPTITKRIALYGVTEDIEKMLERLAQRFENLNIDPEQYGGTEMERGNKFRIGGIEMPNSNKEKPIFKDLMETKLLQPPR